MERKNNVTAREDVRNSERNEKIQNRNTSNTGNKMVRKGKDRQNELHTNYAGDKKAREERNSIFSRRISWIRIENKQANITIINAYAPT
jgi:hypothetical protein